MLLLLLLLPHLSEEVLAFGEMTTGLTSGAAYGQGSRTTERVLTMQTHPSKVHFSVKAALSLVCEYLGGGKKSFSREIKLAANFPPTKGKF